jgi:thioredoxin-dependent peroxiredoxin
MVTFRCWPGDAIARDARRGNLVFLSKHGGQNKKPPPDRQSRRSLGNLKVAFKHADPIGPTRRLCSPTRWSRLTRQSMPSEHSHVGDYTMTIRIGTKAPDFEADTTEGRIHFHEWIGNSWCVLFSHPKDFTPVCTTELGSAAELNPKFEACDCKVIGLSVDSVEDHHRWADDIETLTGYRPNFPMIGDTDLAVAKLYGMLPQESGNSAKGRTATDNQTVRNVFVIAPDKTVCAMIVYPMTTGRNFEEILRLVESIQLTSKHKLATPANWRNGDDVIIVPSVSDEEARKNFPEGWRAPTAYVRYVPQPK